MTPAIASISSLGVAKRICLYRLRFSSVFSLIPLEEVNSIYAVETIDKCFRLWLPIEANLCPMAGVASSAAKMPFPGASKASALAFNSAWRASDKYDAAAAAIL